MFITVLQLSSILPCMRLIFFTESNLKNLVATLIIDCGNRPKRIKDKDEGRFEVDIESRLETPRGKGDIGEDGSREGVSWKVNDNRIVEFKGGIGILGCYSSIVCMKDVELTKSGLKIPASFVGNQRKTIYEADLVLGFGIYVFLSCLKCCYIGLN